MLNNSGDKQRTRAEYSRHRFGNLKVLHRIMTNLPEPRDLFRGALTECTTHNPDSIEYIVLLMAPRERDGRTRRQNFIGTKSPLDPGRRWRIIAGTLRVLVDVGHTATSPGADSARPAPEYEFNLKLADVIAQSLHEASRAQDLLLRSVSAAREQATIANLAAAWRSKPGTSASCPAGISSASSSIATLRTGSPPTCTHEYYNSPGRIERGHEFSLRTLIANWQPRALSPQEAQWRTL
jgi:hypothetical protein